MEGLKELLQMVQAREFRGNPSAMTASEKSAPVTGNGFPHPAFDTSENQNYNEQLRGSAPSSDEMNMWLKMLKGAK